MYRHNIVVIYTFYLRHMTRKHNMHAWIENCIYLAFLFSFLAFGYKLVTTKTLPLVNLSYLAGSGEVDENKTLETSKY